MNVINTVLGKPLGWLMYIIYQVVHNYGATIILFTLLSKLILLPISLMVQKNSIKMVKLQPEIRQIKLLYAGNKERISEEQFKLFEREGYSPAVGCLPTLLQVPIILGLIQVIYHPLQHLYHLGTDVIAVLSEKVAALLNVVLDNSSAELQIIGAIQNAEFSETIHGWNLLSAEVFERIKAMQLNFLGFDLAEVPSLNHPDIALLMPVLSGLSALALCIHQNHENVLQKEQNGWEKWGTTVLLVAFSTYFAFLVPCGIGLYWVFSNLFAMAQLVLLNKIYDPRKYIDYEERARMEAAEKETGEEAEARREREHALQRREREDEEKFYEAKNKLVVFYSEKSGFYNYFAEIIEYLTSHSKIVIHYVTGDPDDQVFSLEIPHLVPYYISDKRLGQVFASMDADIVVMTMPDLNTFHIKRSIVRKDIEYLYVFHAPDSTTLTYRKGAFDHFDTIFCVGPHHVREIRETEAKYRLKPKQLIEHGYGQLDKLMRDYVLMKQSEKPHEKPVILIAPSHQVGNIMESLLDIILDRLDGKGYTVVVRPHPQYVRRSPERIRYLQEKYADKLGDNLIFEFGFSSHKSIYASDLVITDWSAIAFEFSYVTERPTLFINTPMKVINDEYSEYENQPIELEFRNVGGVSIEENEVSRIDEVIADMLDRSDEFSEAIRNFRGEHVFNLGHSGENGGKYIINCLREKHRNK